MIDLKQKRSLDGLLFAFDGNSSFISSFHNPRLLTPVYRFREMCEDSAPVKALHFLQSEVSSVVDHSDSQEEEIFRSLLTHLLAPPRQRPLTLSAPINPPPRILEPITEASESPPTSASNIEHDDSRLDSNRPRKRSRGDGAEGTWTSTIPENEFGSEHEVGSFKSAESSRVSAHALRTIVDPLEEAESDATDDEKHVTLSATRYGQRMEVFESLLAFISDEEKEPAGSLLDWVDRDGLWADKFV